MGAPKNELGINQWNKSRNKEEGDVEPEMGKHWIVRLKDITPKKAFGKTGGQLNGIYPKGPAAKTGSNSEPVLRDT